MRIRNWWQAAWWAYLSNLLGGATLALRGPQEPPQRRPYDWAHRVRYLAPNYYITGKPIPNTWEHEQPFYWLP